jgi:hypothetical protein
MSNPQIAERIFHLEGSGQDHLVHVSKKLDVHSRAEFNARAVGLTERTMPGENEEVIRPGDAPNQGGAPA